MLKKIKKWWNGEWESWSDSTSFGIGLNRHWTSRFAHKILDYIVKHQAWIIPTLITVIVSIILAKP